MKKKHAMGPNNAITLFGPCSVQSAPVSLLAGGGDGGGGIGTVVGVNREVVVVVERGGREGGGGVGVLGNGGGER